VEAVKSRQRLLEAAFARLGREGGIPNDLLALAARDAGCTPEQARLYFRRDEDLILAFYARLASQLEARVPDLPEGTLAERFAAAMETKLALLAPYRDAVGALLASLLDPRHELSALGEQTEVIRRRVMGVFSAVVLGASDRPPVEAKELTAALVRGLYSAHLALVLLWTQDRTPDRRAAHTALGFARDLLALFGPALSAPELAERALQMDSVFGPLVEAPPDPGVAALAEDVLRRVFRHRRLLPDSPCAEAPCGQCFALHVLKARHFIAAGAPVHFVLPAFPAKSPSPRKVLGKLPDKAEELALEYLEAACAEVREIYPPGARITICSDGRAFGDLVGVEDDDVSAYGREIQAIIERRSLGSLNTFHMEDLFDTAEFGRMRELLSVHYGEPLERIEQQIRDFPRHRALFNGIHRFMFEERVDQEGAASRTQVREACKELAVRVIQRSDAWGRLVAESFPLALRLSIHPQAPHSEKIGILLGEAEDVWLTPWHGAAVKRGGVFTLNRASDALSQPGARVIVEAGRPSHVEVDE